MEHSEISISKDLPVWDLSSLYPGMRSSELKQDLEKVAEKAIIGIIGGSGIDQIEDLKGAQWNSISSPFGKSSDDLLFGEIDEVPIVFLPRHLSLIHI